MKYWKSDDDDDDDGGGGSVLTCMPMPSSILNYQYIRIASRDEEQETKKIPKSQVNFDILPPPPTLTTYCILTVVAGEIRKGNFSGKTGRMHV